VTPLRALLAGVAALLLGTCSARPDALAQARALGELRVATRNSPSAYYLGPLGPEGPEFELVTLFARTLGLHAVFITCDSAAAVLSEVAHGRVQLGAAALVAGEGNPAGVTFARPYAELPRHVVYRKDDPRPDGVGALVGRRLAVVGGSGHARALRAALSALGAASAIVDVPNADSLDLLDGVSSHEFDATVADSNEFALVRTYHPELRIAFNLPGREPLAWAMPRGDAVLGEAISHFLTADESMLTGILAHYQPEDDRFAGYRAFMRDVQERLPKYRHFFHQAAAAVGEDWRVLAAIGYQESRWDPSAVSPTGVKGLMMLQTDTAQSLGVQDRGDPAASIAGGARYLHDVRATIPDRVPEPDRTWLALAAYNVGYGHLEDARVLAQSHGKNPDSWQDVREYLPLLDQERWYTELKRGYAPGLQAVHFVDHVRTYLDILDWLAPDPSAPEPSAG
jgi:membrane-bound lytic murein transglycosylase F